MSQKVSRKSAAVNEDKEKRNTDSPVKEMKKKMAANAEKEKQAAEKADKPEKSSEKVAEKIDKPEKSTDKKAERSEKPEKSSDKKVEKSEKPEKSLDKKAEKKEAAEKKNDKPEPQAEKSKEESTSKEDKAGKPEKERTEPKKDAKPKQNGRAHNGVSDVTHDNGDDVNGTVSAGSDDEDVMLVIDDHDEVFPELTYDDTSDVECFEPPTPDSVPSRSFTRRSQVKATRTPETPRPASDKQTDSDDPKDSKVLKLKDDATSTDRKLRSADSPKPHDKKDVKEQEKEGQKEDSKDVVGDKAEEKTQEKSEMEVIVEVDVNEGEEVQRKTDTNYSKSRVKVSPYRRSMRIADQTNTSNIANYTGNNTTMEMDITESSSFLEADNLDDSSYLRGLRSIRGRSSYKQLKEISLKHVNRSTRSNASANVSSTEHNRPTGTVVGRKRKPDNDDSIELATEAHADTVTTALPVAGGVKRMRVLDRLTEPFRRVATVASVATVAVTLPAAHRRNAEIVGINTDLPLSAPVASEATFDPESLKNVPQHDAPVAVPLPPPTQTDKRCVVM